MRNFASPLFLLALAALTGCASAPPVPSIVKVPVVLPCEKPDVDPVPVLLTDSINKQTADDATGYAYVHDVEALKGYVKHLAPLVGKCKPNPGTQP